MTDVINQVGTGSFDIDYKIEMHGDAWVISFKDDIDAVAVPFLKTEIDPYLNQDLKHIIVDLSEVKFLDSTGVGFFATLLKRAHANGGDLIFAGAIAQPRAVLEMVGFDDLAVYQPSVEEAVLHL